MISFMFSILGSVMFWCIFIPVNFVIGIIVQRVVDPDSLKPFTHNEQICGRDEPTGESYLGSILMIIICTLFWWLIILCLIIWKIGCLISPIFISIIKKAVNIVPNIEITTKENKK